MSEGGAAALNAHLQSGTTTVCRCWAVRRRDGRVLGFTDHDRTIAFDEVVFSPGTGFSAQAFEQTTGLAVDNSAAVGALSADAITEGDIRAGRYDGAEVTVWLVNWQDPSIRDIQFAGTIGEISFGSRYFEAELRGISEKLNEAHGRVFQRPCTAVLGDESCGIDLDDPDYSRLLTIRAIESGTVLRFDGIPEVDDGWFEFGRLQPVSGEAAGMFGHVKLDRMQGGERIVELWQEFRAPLAIGDSVRIDAGCNKRPTTCQKKFRNFINFRGFPHVPGEDWLTAYPTRGGNNDGGSANPFPGQETS